MAIWPFKSPTPIATEIAGSLLSDRFRWDRDNKYIWRRDDGLSLFHDASCPVWDGRSLGIALGRNRQPDSRQGNLPTRDKKHIRKALRRVWKDDQAQLRSEVRDFLGLTA